MKIVFIALLIAAVGTGVYYYVSKMQNVHPSNPKELIVDKWKIDSLAIGKVAHSLSKSQKVILSLRDSSLKKYEIEFRKDSLILRVLNGKIQDTSHCEFTDSKIS